MSAGARTTEILKRHEADILQDWIQRQLGSGTARPDLIKKSELEDQSRAFLDLFAGALQRGGEGDVGGPAWEGVRDLLGSISRSRSKQGLSLSQTAMFVFSLKEALFARLQ